MFLKLKEVKTELITFMAKQLLLLIFHQHHPWAQVDNLRLTLDFSVVLTLCVTLVTKPCRFHPPAFSLSLHPLPPSLLPFLPLSSPSFLAIKPAQIKKNKTECIGEHPLSYFGDKRAC